MKKIFVTAMMIAMSVGMNAQTVQNLSEDAAGGA